MIDDSTYVYVSLGVLSVNLGFFISKGVSFSSFSSFGLNDLPPYRLFLFFEFIYLCFLVFLFYRLNALVDIWSEYWRVRFYFFGLELDGVNVSILKNSIFANIFFLFKYFSFVSFLVSLPFFFLYNRRLLFYISLINIFLYCIVSGGRDVIAYLIVFVFFAFYSKIYTRSAFYIFLAFAFVMLMTYLRQGGFEKTLYALFSYFTGSLVFFDHHIQNVDSYSYGSLIVSTMFSLLVSIFGLHNESVAVGTDLMMFVQISDESQYYNFYNALPTMFYYIYKDFGYFPSLLFMVYFGFFLGLIVHRLKLNNYFHVSVLSFVMYTLLWTIFRPEPIMFGSIFTLFFALYFSRIIRFRRY